MADVKGMHGKKRTLKGKKKTAKKHAKKISK